MIMRQLHRCCHHQHPYLLITLLKFSSHFIFEVSSFFLHCGWNVSFFFFSFAPNEPITRYVFSNLLHQIESMNFPTLLYQVSTRDVDSILLGDWYFSRRVYTWWMKQLLVWLNVWLIFGVSLILVSTIALRLACAHDKHFGLLRFRYICNKSNWCSTIVQTSHQIQSNTQHL